MTTVPSENILRLRKLTKEICSSENQDEYKDIVLQLKEILEEGNEELGNTKTMKKRVKCYESMYLTFTKLLDNAFK